MTFLSRWREPRELEYRRLGVDEGTVDALDERWEVVRPLPPVIVVTDSAILRWSLYPQYGDGLSSLLEMGYLQVERETFCNATRFVRGRWLWCLHKAGGWLWGRSRWLAWWGRQEPEAPRW